MSEIQYKCPECNGKFDTDDESCGFAGICPLCGEWIEIDHSRTTIDQQVQTEVKSKEMHDTFKMMATDKRFQEKYLGVVSNWIKTIVVVGNEDEIKTLGKDILISLDPAGPERLGRISYEGLDMNSIDDTLFLFILINYEFFKVLETLLANTNSGKMKVMFRQAKLKGKDDTTLASIIKEMQQSCSPCSIIVQKANLNRRTKVALLTILDTPEKPMIVPTSKELFPMPWFGEKT